LASKQIPVTYFSQRDNKIKPNYSCFPTSIAMAVDYVLQREGATWKDVAPDGVQMEDHINMLLEDGETTIWLRRRSEILGEWVLTTTRRENWYAEGYICDRLIGKYNYSASYKRLNYQMLRDQIDRDLPVVIGGNYSSTSRVGAHVVCAVGYDTKLPGIIVNDPFGDAREGYPKYKTIEEHERAGRGVLYPMQYYGDGSAVNAIWISKK
jgi:hypothetical protein